MSRSPTPSPGIGIRQVARTVLFVKEMGRALAFYRNVLGLETAYPASEHWAAMERGGTWVCLHQGRKDVGPSEEVQILYFTVEDFDASLERLRASGVGVRVHATPAGKRLGIFHDPDGNGLGIEES